MTNIFSGRVLNALTSGTILTPLRPRMGFLSFDSMHSKITGLIIDLACCNHGTRLASLVACLKPQYLYQDEEIPLGSGPVSGPWVILGDLAMLQLQMDYGPTATMTTNAMLV